MKLNIGCGNNRLEGYINIDKVVWCNPDKCFDLEKVWPIPDGSVDEIVATHVLEHMRDFVYVACEIYRVLKVGGKVFITVPHPRSDEFLGDPTHVRPIIPGTLEMFGKEANERYRAERLSNTPFAEYLGVDLKLIAVDYCLRPQWKDALDNGEISIDDIKQALVQLNNVAGEIKMIWEKAS